MACTASSLSPASRALASRPSPRTWPRTPSGRITRASTTNRRTATSLDLVKLADAGVAVIVVTHVNVRGLKGCPQPKHLKLSGAFEQAAWIVGGYWRPTDKERGIRAFQVTKERVRTTGRPVLHLELAGPKLVEVGLQRAAAAPTVAAEPRRPPGEVIAEARRDHPGLSLRQLAKLTGLSKSMINRLDRGGK